MLKGPLGAGSQVASFYRGSRSENKGRLRIFAIYWGDCTLVGEPQ